MVWVFFLCTMQTNLKGYVPILCVLKGVKYFWGIPHFCCFKEFTPTRFPLFSPPWGFYCCLGNYLMSWQWLLKMQNIKSIFSAALVSTHNLHSESRRQAVKGTTPSPLLTSLVSGGLLQGRVEKYSGIPTCPEGTLWLPGEYITGIGSRGEGRSRH